MQAWVAVTSLVQGCYLLERTEVWWTPQQEETEAYPLAWKLAQLRQGERKVRKVNSTRPKFLAR